MSQIIPEQYMCYRAKEALTNHREGKTRPQW